MGGRKPHGITPAAATAVTGTGAADTQDLWTPADPDRPPLWCIIPSEYGQAQITTILTINNAAHLLGRVLVTANPQAGNIPRGRNLGMDELRNILRVEGMAIPDRLWVLWVDSDIRVQADQAEAIAQYILRAEAEGVGWTADYHMFAGEQGVISTMLKERSFGAGATHYTLEEIAAMEDWSPIPLAGFGLCYLPMPTDYVFRADRHGEDIHFWRDHPDLPLRLAKGVTAYHMKHVLL